MVVAGITYYHVRVLHHHPWRAAALMVYKSSQLITTVVFLFATYNSLFSCFGLAMREEPTTTATHRIPDQQQQAVEVATVVARTATSTPDLDQLRRLLGQEMHRAGTSPRTIDALFFFRFDGRMLCLQLALFVSVFPSCYHGPFFYMCLANQSVVSKPHPTEGAEIYTGCGIPRCYKVCCTVCTPLRAGRCAHCLYCSLFFRCLDCSFPMASDFFGEIDKRVRAHPMYRMHMTRASLA